MRCVVGSVSLWVWVVRGTSTNRDWVACGLFKPIGRSFHLGLGTCAPGSGRLEVEIRTTSVEAALQSILIVAFVQSLHGIYEISFEVWHFPLREIFHSNIVYTSK